MTQRTDTKIVIAGGSGDLGRLLHAAFAADGHEVVVLSRSGRGPGRVVRWDGERLGDWVSELEGARVLINLAGRSVDCRYTAANLVEMMESRVLSTRVLGRAIAACDKGPELWLQMSTATIYAHRFDAPNDESGPLGGNEPGAPRYWNFSIRIAEAWERELDQAQVPGVRKVAMRTAMVMSAQPGGVFDVLKRMARFGLGGPIAGGKQMVSWIHAEDFVDAVRFLMERGDLSGAINLTSPTPLPQAQFMADLRRAVGAPFGLPATAWMAEIGAFFLRTDTELLLKSRYVIPGRLQREGFAFQHPGWSEAAHSLIA